MQHTQRERTIALAGVFQAADLVKQLASTGTMNNANVESSIESLFRFDADSVEGVYGNISGIASGIRVMRQQFASNNSERDLEITKYVISLLSLEKKFSSNPSMMEYLHNQLLEIKDSVSYFSLLHENIFSKLADLYSNTISTIGPKIIVSSNKAYLTNKQNADKVRALLLAGIRSAVLWRQCGGSKWQILFSRKRYIEECDVISSELSL